MNQLGGLTARRALIGLAALIIVGGFVLALISSSTFGLSASMSAAPAASQAGEGLPNSQLVGGLQSSLASLKGSVFGTSLGSSVTPYDHSQVIGQVTTMTTTLSSGTFGGQPPAQVGSNVSQGSPGSAGGLIEFSSDLSIRSATPQQTASGVVALAYSVGGYVAYQSTYSTSANVVIRVPAAEYQQVLGKVEGLGTVIGLTSNSNDVRVQYTDLNATLASLKTEQGALLRLLNQSTAINSTLAIESQLQGVNQQINDIESQILQTKTLVDYATIDVTITEAAQQAPLSMSLSAIPTNGTAPLSVTFNAVVKGGAQPYVVNYNFGDGYASQGQIVIHTYYQPGDYEVTVSATDQNGTVAQAMATVKVEAAPSQTGVQGFVGTVSNLFVSVVEGIVEVAVVVLPLAAVGAAIIIPVQRRSRTQKVVKQGQ